MRAALGDGASIYTVHRLDRVVGGVMVLARTRHAARDLSAQIRARTFQKEYLAVTSGGALPPTGRFSDLLARDKAQRKTYVADAPGPDARPAVLNYVRLARRQELDLVRILLHTGRTHQIRAQFSAHGSPLAGDVKYGAPPAPFGVALWSSRLRFIHPKTGQAMDFTAPAPAAEPWLRFSPLPSDPLSRYLSPAPAENSAPPAPSPPAGTSR